MSVFRQYSWIPFIITTAVPCGLIQVIYIYMCPKNGDHALCYDVQSVADMVMVISEHDHKINTNLHTNIKIDDTLDALFKADHVILIWCNFITSFLHNFRCYNLVTSTIVVRYWSD